MQMNVHHVSMEHPALSIVRQEKLTEVMRKYLQIRAGSSNSTSQRHPLGSIDEETIRVALDRWMIRAAHGVTPFLDPLIPSWTEKQMLRDFLQRQFISESRRAGSSATSSGLTSIEILKEAGAAMAEICEDSAKSLADFRSEFEDQLPHDWSDTSIEMSASEVLSNNGSSNIIVIDWARRAQVQISFSALASLKNRYAGPPHRFLAAVFALVMRYETRRIITAGTILDQRIAPSTISCLKREVHVNVEALAEPLSVYENNFFCGMFPDVDKVFGGCQPFAKEGGGGEVTLLENGGSVIMMPPLESSTAARYIQTMLDLLERADGVCALSFVVVLPAECFRDLKSSSPSIDDIPSLDPRLGDPHYHRFFRMIEILPAGQHTYWCDNGEGTPRLSQTGSLLLLFQNEFGLQHFPIDDSAFGRIAHSFGMNLMLNEASGPVSMMSGVSFAGQVSESPIPPSPSIPVVDSAMSGISGAIIGGIGSFSSESTGRGGRRRGRLFDLVDDGDEGDAGNDMDDVLSGMLNVDASMFRSASSQEVDIEAISLMGIAGGTIGRSRDVSGGRF